MKKDSTSPAPKKAAKSKPASVPVPPSTGGSTNPTPTPPPAPAPVSPSPKPSPAPNPPTGTSPEYTFNLMEKSWINKTFSEMDDSVKPEIFNNIKEVITNITNTHGYTSPQEAFLDMTKIISRIASLYNGGLSQEDIYDIIINNSEGLIDTYKKSCEAFPEKSQEQILAEMLTIDDEGNLDVTELQNEC